MFLDNIIWLAIGFLPIYGAMELVWRLARRMAANKNKMMTVTEEEEEEKEAIVASLRPKVTKQE